MDHSASVPARHPLFALSHEHADPQPQALGPHRAEEGTYSEERAEHPSQAPAGPGTLPDV